MSQSTTLILLPQTAYQNPGNGAPYTVVGNTQPAAAYYLGNQDLQTVTYGLTRCTGNVIIEATLASSPTNEDWFKVFQLETANSNIVSYTNIEGNFVYIRAKVEDFNDGVVNYIKISY